MQFAWLGNSATRRGKSGLIVAAAALVLASAVSSAAMELGFSSTVTPGLIGYLTGRFGTEARPRTTTWTDFAKRQQVARGQRSQASPESGQLQAVNAFVNAVPWVEDQQHWGQIDYWATPSETYSSHGGDCEDFAIAKYFLLKELGVPIERLRITYVRAIKINTPHMVLAYYAIPGAEPLILDNLEGRIRPASERSDLVPVYSFNDEDVVILQGNRKGSSSQIRAWQGLIDRLERESRL